MCKGENILLLYSTHGNPCRLDRFYLFAYVSTHAVSNLMDAPSSFFFNLGWSKSQRKQMVCLCLPDATLTSDLVEMKRHTVAFYLDLFTEDDCNQDAAADLLMDLHS